MDTGKNKFVMFFAFSLGFLVIALGIAYYYYIKSNKTIGNDEPEKEQVSQYQKWKIEQKSSLDEMKSNEKITEEKKKEIINQLDKLAKPTNNPKGVNALDELNNGMSEQDQLDLLNQLK